MPVPVIAGVALGAVRAAAPAIMRAAAPVAARAGANATGSATSQTLKKFAGQTISNQLIKSANRIETSNSAQAQDTGYKQPRQQFIPNNPSTAASQSAVVARSGQFGQGLMNG